MNKHTSGPWWSKQIALNDNTGDRLLRIYAGEDLPANEILTLSADSGEIDANAHLIAAAPELLAAAEQALVELWGQVGVKSTIAMLVAAIAKAEGES